MRSPAGRTCDDPLGLAARRLAAFHEGFDAGEARVERMGVAVRGTLLALLGLNPGALDSVRIEGVTALPGIPAKGAEKAH